MSETSTDSASEQDPVVEELTRAQCLALLANHEIGRLAVSEGGQPEIFPINYLLDDERVIFRSGAGTKLTNASLDRVAFEIDEYDLKTHEGWSVVVKGTAREITEALDDLSERERLLPVEPWVPERTLHWVRIIPREITGRRLRRSEGRP